MLRFRCDSEETQQYICLHPAYSNLVGVCPSKAAVCQSNMAASLGELTLFFPGYECYALFIFRAALSMSFSGSWERDALFLTITAYIQSLRVTRPPNGTVPFDSSEM